MTDIEVLFNPIMVKYYHEHPDKFIEEILGLKLNSWQKEYLNEMYTRDDNDDDDWI